MWIGMTHLGLNEKDRFFEAMNAACDDKAPFLRYLNRAAFLQRFASDDRFQRLLERLRLNES